MKNANGKSCLEFIAALFLLLAMPLGVNGASATSAPVHVDSRSIADIVTLEPDSQIRYSRDFYYCPIGSLRPEYSVQVSYMSTNGLLKGEILRSAEGGMEGFCSWDFEKAQLPAGVYDIVHSVMTNGVPAETFSARVAIAPEPALAISILALLGLGLLRKSKKACGMGLMLVLASLSSQANVTVSDIEPCQRWPWNGLVDIDYTLSSTDGGDAFTVNFYGKLSDGSTFELKSLKGEGAAGFVLGTGRHRATWDMSADKPGIVDDNFTVTITAYDATSYPYIMLDLETNKIYPQAGAPDNIVSNAACRMTEMWFRRCEAGTFTMGSPENEVGSENTRRFETQHEVTLSRPFYIGIFEVTFGQMFYGIDKPEYLDPHHKDDMGYFGTPSSEYYGSSGSYGPWVFSCYWDGQMTRSNDFNCVLSHKLRTKTGLVFDCPTEAQWEYACRAGERAAFSNGENMFLVQHAIYGSYYITASISTIAHDSYNSIVGTLKPNNWGIYDMHGNQKELCLDVYPFDDEKFIRSGEPETDPLYAGKSPVNDVYICRSGVIEVPRFTKYDTMRSSAVDSVRRGYGKYGARLAIYMPGEK